MLDSCCISIGLVFIKDRQVSSFWLLRFRSRVLRLRVLGASFASFGCFVFEFWVLHFRDLGVFVFEFWVLRFRSRVLRASVFVFECFVFETTGLSWAFGETVQNISKITHKAGRFSFIVRAVSVIECLNEL